jgi:hypothetical protein
MKYIYILFLTICALLPSPRLTAQNNPGEVNISLLPGETYYDTIFSVSGKPSSLVFNCSVESTDLGNSLYAIEINGVNTQSVTGRAIVEYLLPGIKIKYTTYNINFVDSKIKARPDFVTISDDEPLTINPLLNDESTTSGLTLNGVSQVQYGTATYENDVVTYTPSADLKSDYIVYSLSDSLGAKANSVIYILREDENALANDTLRYTLLNTSAQHIILPFAGFELDESNLAEKGIVSQLHDLVYFYEPNDGATGTDSFLFSDEDGNSRLVIIKLINIPHNNSTVRDDKFYTPKNTPITFDVFANDLNSKFPISAYSSALVRDTLGIFNYTPPANFSGEKNFTYTVNYGANNKYTGKIKIVIGNFQPQSDIEYTFNTDKNTSLALEYDVPVSGYSFQIVDAPSFGTVEIFNDSTSIEENCNQLTTKAMILYTPDQNYYGADEISVEYCIENNPCQLYKLYINIVDSDQDTLCKCVGRDCVWAGDLNGDGRVSVTDLLSLGRYMGLTGASRDDLPYSYRAGQHSDSWNVHQPNGSDTKHIDANGDGILTASDTMAISEYYAAIHNLVPTEVLGIKDYPFMLIPNSTELDSGDLLILDVAIGTETNPVVDIFGLAFGLNFSPSLIDSASLTGYFYKDGWFATASPTLQMVKQPTAGTLHAAFTRLGSIVVDEVEGIKPTGTSGNGIIGQILSIVVDEVEGIRSDDEYVTRRITTNNIEMEDAAGEKFILPDTFVDIRINNKKTTPVPSEDKLLAFPNPAKEYVNLHFNGRNTIKAYKIVDMFGNMVGQVSNLDQQSVSINTKNYATGIYLLQVVTTQGVITKKINITAE